MDLSPQHRMAMLFAQQGIKVFPLHSIKNGDCDCNKEGCVSPGKHPRWHKVDVPNGHISASKDLDQINIWWNRWPRANLGVATGKDSDLLVIDVDGEKGKESFKRLTEGMQLEPTFIVETGGGGLHYYFQLGGATIPSHNDPTREVCIDLKCEGGYVVGPSSRHLSGRCYEILDGGGSMAPVPLELVEKILKESGPSLGTPTHPRLSTALEERTKGPVTEKEWEAIIPHGNRNVQFTRLVGQFLARNHTLPLSAIIDYMLVHDQKYCDPPMGEEQVRKIIGSIAPKETRKMEEEKAQEKPRSEVFRILNTLEMFELYSGFEQEWIIKDFLPAGTVGMIGAATQTYKTWMLLSLAYAVSTGGKFLGHYQSLKKGTVLIVQQEDPMPLLIKRLSSIMNIGEVKRNGNKFTLPKMPDMPDIIWHPDSHLHVSDRQTMDGLERTIDKNNVLLVMIDPVYSIAPVDDFMAGAAQSLLQLKDLRNKYGTSFMLVHHTTNKGDELWGSQFIKAWRETSWMAQSLGPDTIQLDRHTKASPALSSLEIKFNITDGSFSTDITDIGIEAPVVNAKRKKKEEEAVIPLPPINIRSPKLEIQDMVVKGTPVRSNAELARLLDVSVKRISEIFKQLGIHNVEGKLQFKDIEETTHAEV